MNLVLDTSCRVSPFVSAKGNRYVRIEFLGGSFSARQNGEFTTPVDAKSLRLSARVSSVKVGEYTRVVLIPDTLLSVSK